MIGRVRPAEVYPWNTTLCLTLVLLSAGAPVPKDLAPLGPAPYVLKYQLETDGVIRFFGSKLLAMQELLFHLRDSAEDTTQIVGLELADLKGLTIYTVDGQEVSIKDATKKLAAGAPAVASSDGKKVDPEKRKSLKADTMILVAPDLVKHNPKNGFPTLTLGESYPEPVLPAIPVGK